MKNHAFLRALSWVAILAVLAQSPAAFAFGGMCSKGKDPGCSNIPKDDVGNQATSICKYLDASDNACTLDQTLAISYAAIAVTCGLACFDVYAKELEPVCSFGSIALSLVDLAGNFMIDQDMKKYEAAVAANENGIQKYSALGLNVMNGVRMAASMGKLGKIGASMTKTTSGNKNKGGSCWSFAFDVGLATVKQWNVFKIADNGDKNLNTLHGLDHSTHEKKTGGGGGSQITPVTGGAAATVGDVRSSVNEVATDDKLPSNARIGEAFATAGERSLFQNPHPKAVTDALDALKDHLGLTPEKLASAMQAGNLAGVVGAAVGGDEGENAAAIADAIKSEVEKSAPAMNFELAHSGGGGGGSKSGGGDPFAGLLGNRGPAAEVGGVKSMQFGGFSNDIWHAGTTLSIFDIVSKKTTEVSSRVQH